MEIKKFANKIEAFSYLKDKLLFYLGEHYDETQLQDFADEVGLRLSDVKSFIDSQDLDKLTTFTVVPIFHKFFCFEDILFLLEDVFPKWVAFKRLTFSQNANWRYLFHYKTFFDPVILDFKEWAMLNEPITKQMMENRFGEKISEFALQKLMKIDFFIKQGDQYTVNKINFEISHIPQIANMQADLDIFPHILVQPQYVENSIFSRINIKAGPEKLQRISLLNQKFREEFSKVAYDYESDEYKKDPLIGQLVFNLLCYTRTDFSAIQPVYRKEERQLKILEKITQMFAHDVRKPFALVDTIMSMIADCNDIDQVKKITKKYNVLVQHSLDQINLMLQDVLNMGDGLRLVCKTFSLRNLLFNVVLDTFRFNNNCKISFEYNLNHTMLINGDESKLARVFQNILQNACQAMNQKGKIWFRTQDQVKEGQNFLLFCIGNSDSYIAPTELVKLFEPFYTFNKKGGTGLGLAIAHKIVTEHGGEIWCQSVKGFGVEFYILLPTVLEKDDIVMEFPMESSEISEVPTAKVVDIKNHENTDSESYVVVVDDSVLILEAWRRVDPKVVTFTCPEEFFSRFKKGNHKFSEIVAIVTDYFFEDTESQYHGVKFAEELRALGFEKPIFLASAANHELHNFPQGVITDIVNKNPKNSLKRIREFL